MTKNQYIAKVLRAHEHTLKTLLTMYDLGQFNETFEAMHKSLGNVAVELTKMPSPAMAPGTQRQKFDPKPNSEVVKPKPKPRKPAPAAMATV